MQCWDFRTNSLVVVVIIIKYASLFGPFARAPPRLEGTFERALTYNFWKIAQEIDHFPMQFVHWQNYIGNYIIFCVKCRFTNLKLYDIINI